MYKFTGTSPAKGMLLTRESNDQNIDALLTGSIWDSKNLTYAIPVTVDYYSSPNEVGDTFNSDFNINDYIDNFVPATASMQKVYEKALASISEFSQLKFTKAPDHIRSDLAIGSFTPPPDKHHGVGFLPTSRQAGDLWIPDYAEPSQPGDIFTSLILHELGHTLGLGHGHDLLTPDRNSSEFTIMTYYKYIGDETFDQNEQFGRPQTFMMYDIAAIQFMYGANFTSNAGNNIYTFNSNTGEMSIDGMSQGATSTNRIFRTIWDGNGNDTYNLSNYITDLNIDLTPGGWSVFSKLQLAELGDGVYARGNVFNALQYQGDVRSLIENAIGGSGNDTITGNSAHNSLYGKAGNDTLNGSTGADSLYGGEGADKHLGGADSSVDLARYDDANYGNLVINMSNTSLNTGAAKGDTYDGIEGIHGGDGNDTITGLDDSLKGEFLYGGRGHDHIYGLKGNDSLNGGIGADSLYGGEGADIHLGDDGGADGTNRDYARYDDANYGNLVINMSNTSLNTGAAKGDTYDGIEGVIGGVGNDTITGYDLFNKMEDLQGDRGNDFIYALAGDDDLNGGAGDDHLYGGAGDDYHIGALGNDHLYGGTGRDVHDGGEGIDIANYSDADYGNLTLSLSASTTNQGAAAVGDTYISIEGLAGGNGVDFIFGDGNANFLYGAKGNDTLDGGGGNDNLYGGLGADKHTGGSGIDLARYDDQNYGDLTINLGNSALNKGDAAVGDTYSVGVEGLVGGAGNDTIFGDVSDNSLYGLGGNDIISGLLGNDTLFGGAGADQFKFDTGITAKPNVDVIKDFDTTADKIALSTKIFTKIGSTLDTGEFFTGAAAKDTNDYLIYKQITGALFYDADGSGAGAQIHFATITANTVLSYDDFLMFSL